MPLRINGKEPTAIFVGSQEVQRAVLNGKTLYELMREVTLVKKSISTWESVPTNSLCYPMQRGDKLGVSFRHPVKCSNSVKLWDGSSYVFSPSSAVIPADTATVPDYKDGNYVFTRV